MKEEGRKKKEEKTFAGEFNLNSKASVCESIYPLPSSFLLLPY
jgi:hypothetical protein